MKKLSSKEKLYLSWRNPDKTWRQFWEEIHGKNPFWMSTTQYGGEWLDKKMNEPNYYIPNSETKADSPK